jgi:hypothetical protein
LDVAVAHRTPGRWSPALHPRHATISITLGVHQHALPTLQHEAADQVAGPIYGA